MKKLLILLILALTATACEPEIITSREFVRHETVDVSCSTVGYCVGPKFDGSGYGFGFSYSCPGTERITQDVYRLQYHYASNTDNIYERYEAIRTGVVRSCS